MTKQDSTTYYRRREQQERARANAATDRAAAAIHLELASSYAELASGGAPMTRQLAGEGAPIGTLDASDPAEGGGPAASGP
ncbi:hypothetical protein [Sphingomonas bacterium]|uniref:hypothetical protein n=1 Tax=Sphingomonas bacterium TaxID=1895847 RepID=UPI0015756DFB|nr:hypothetical protein [Sphingomonas bacterium]